MKTKTDEEKYVITLAKINALIENYFQEIGRGGDLDTDTMRIDLVENIDELLSSVNIPSKYKIIEKYNMDDKN